MKLALIQLTVEDVIDDNFKKIQLFLSETKNKNLDLIALPECFLYLSNNSSSLIENALPYNNKYLDFFKLFALENKVMLLLGSIAIKDSSNIYNCSFLISKKGQIISTYKKIHMFDVSLDSGETYKESETFTPGNELNLINIGDYLAGHSICYDLRFPKLYRSLAKNGASIIFAPSAFTYSTGKDHWHILVRSRAIENGVFIIAPNQCGTNRANRSTYGHSLVVDPWGKVIIDGGEAEDVLYCEIDLKTVKKIQNFIPAIKHDKNFEYEDKKNFNIVIKK